LIFRDGRQVELTTARDGWGLAVDEQGYEPTDLGEAGRIVQEDLSLVEPFRQAIGQTLTAISIVGDGAEPSPIGVRCFFGREHGIYVLNWGDELYVGSTLPHDASTYDLTESAL
jgi:hypothetical protein